MNPIVFFLLVAAGGVGAGARYVIDLALTALVGARFPWGTLAINVVGSFALGLLAGAVSDATVLAVVGAGLLGGFTTFSSVAAASAVMLRERRSRAAIANTIGTLVLTLIAAAAGLALG